MTDVTAHSLGISVFETAGERQRPVTTALLRRNTALPASAERTFFTMRPGETRIVVPVLEGESDDPDLCRRVGVVVIDGLPPHRPAHQPVSVTMSLNENGILQVAATDVSTGAQASTTGAGACRAGACLLRPRRRGRRLADRAVPAHRLDLRGVRQGGVA